MAAAKKMEEKAGKKMVKIKLPRGQEGEANFITASMNGKVYKIQRGVSVDVPKGLAEVIYNSDIARDRAIEYIEAKAEE